MKHRYKRIPKESPKGALIKKCDKLLREILLIKRGSKCEWCDRETQVYVSHILSKGLYTKLRFHELNVLLLCYHCHMQKWHKNPIDAHNFMVSLRGEDYKDQLNLISKISPPLKMFRLQLIHTALTQELETLRRYI